MATYTFSQLTSGQSIAFNPLTDVILFDTYVSGASTVTIRPAELLINGTASGVQFAVGGKSILLSGITLDQLGVSSTTGLPNVRFSGPGLLKVGEHTTGTGGELANTITGSSGDDTLIGLAGQDTLNGGAGADLMVGGADNDSYFVDNIGDIVSETDATAAGGIDTVNTTISYVLPSLVENLVLLGSGHINGTGNGLNNIITGNAGRNVLDGGTGSDTMIGGDGNDTYYVDNAGDRIIDANASLTQIDTVNSTINFILQPTLENLNLIGTGAIHGVGNARANVLNGNAAANTLNGRSGADTMAGGDGNDTYIVDNAGDVVTETNALASQIDMVASTISYTLGANVENLRLLGAGNINGTGNGLANVIHANTGNNIINGGLGTDTVSYADVSLFTLAEGPATVATVTASASSGVTVDLAITTAQDTGGSGMDRLISIENVIGSAFDDDLYGNSGHNVLDGGLGADLLVGRTGNDTYIVDGADQVVELANEGIDRVIASVSYRLGANVENLTLAGTARNGTGNNLDNEIIGNSGANVLDGRGGADRMNGGAGNDTYVIDNLGDQVIDSAGIDQINSFINFDLTATPSIENLRLMGSNSLNGTGNGLNNVMWANTGDNILAGGANSSVGDTVSYEYGSNAGVTINLSLSTAQVTGGSGTDTLSGFENLTGSGFDDYLSGTDGANVLNGLNGIDTVSYLGSSAGLVIDLSARTATTTISGTKVVDKIFNFENVVGSAYNDVIMGDLEDNVLDGGVGADTVSYEFVKLDEGGVVVNLAVTTAQNTQAAGYDTLRGFENLIGSVNNDTLYGSTAANAIQGGDGNDQIYGGRGADELTGGDGRDTFIFKAVTESTVAASDTIADFTVGVDRIHLSSIDAIAATTGVNDAFAFIGTAAAFTGAGQIRVAQSGTDTIAYFNVDANVATAEMAILLENVTASTLSATDFVL